MIYKYKCPSGKWLDHDTEKEDLECWEAHMETIGMEIIDRGLITEEFLEYPRRLYNQIREQKKYKKREAVNG